MSWFFIFNQRKYTPTSHWMWVYTLFTLKLHTNSQGCLKRVVIICIVGVTLLPLWNKAQTTTAKTKNSLIENINEKNIKTTETTLFKDIDISNKTHKEIINIPAEYLPLETLRKHMLIEINKIRDSLWVESLLKINNKVNDCAQEYAKYMYNNNWFEHEDKQKKNHWDRLKKYWFDWKNITSSSENLGKNQKTIYEILDSRLNWWSLPHREALLEKRDNEVWIWYYKWFRVINIISLRD